MPKFLKVPPAFYLRGALRVAPNLLGLILIHQSGGKLRFALWKAKMNWEALIEEGEKSLHF